MSKKWKRLELSIPYRSRAEKESVEHHVREEEDELFPAAEKLFGDDQMRDLAARMREFKTTMGADGTDS